MKEENKNEEVLQLELDVFEGPLDLLLHLINQLEIDIYDIPIAKITNQYLEYLEAMKTNQLNLASEYFVMAANLMRIKSEMLVPRNEDQADLDEIEHEEDPRKPLINLLLEYQQIKDVVPKFEERQVDRADFFGKEPTDLSNYQKKIELDNQGIKIEKLTHIFKKVLKRHDLNEPKERTIDSVKITVPEKMEVIVSELVKAPKGERFFSGILQNKGRQEIVINFLAILELIKNDRVYAKQSSLSADILIILKNIKD